MQESLNMYRKSMLSTRADIQHIQQLRKIFLQVCICLTLIFAQQQILFASGFLTLGNMTSERKNHTSVTLADGRVLIVGGMDTVSTYLSSAEIYDPATGMFTATGSMTTKRANHTATRLPDGKVLITGGSNGTAFLDSAELFDPAAGANGTFTLLPATMSTSRANHTATLLNDGTVLVAGGQNSFNSSFTSAQIYTPETGLFTATSGPLNVGRRSHTATLLADGRVLFAGGGINGSSSANTNSGEIYTPATRTFTTVTALMTSARKNHTAVLLSDDRVLLAGGYSSSTTAVASAEIFDPTGAGSFTVTASPMSIARAGFTATRLLSGKVLLLGGYSSTSAISSSGDLFDPAAGGSFAAAGTMSLTRAFHSSTLLGDGTVLIAGGTAGSTVLSAVDLYASLGVTLSPMAHVFPDTTVSELSTPQMFMITNSSATDLTLDSFGISGADGAMFAIDADTCDPLPYVLPAEGGVCSIIVYFTPTASGLKSASLEITSSDPETPALSAALSGKGMGNPFLTVLFSGTGTGSTSSAQTELNCLSDSITPCTAQVASGTEISVFAMPDAESLFSGWTGGCSGADCTVTVNSDTTVTATFTYIEPVRIGSTYYPTLQAAYAAATAGNVIESRADHLFTGPLYLDKNIAVSLKGGYDRYYAPTADYTIITGGLRIKGGSVAVRNIKVK